MQKVKAIPAMPLTVAILATVNSLMALLTAFGFDLSEAQRVAIEGTTNTVMILVIAVSHAIRASATEERASKTEERLTTIENGNGAETPK